MPSLRKSPTYTFNLIMTRTPYLFLSVLMLIFISACSQPVTKSNQPIVPKIPAETSFQLDDFLTDNKALSQTVSEVFGQLDDTAIVAQVIMPAVGKYGQTRATIESHIHRRMIGGVLMLNGTKSEFTEMIQSFEKLNTAKGNLPFLYSADAEPSLVNRKISGSTLVKKAAEIKTLEELISVAQTISNELNSIGINYNFAPVVDVAGNATVGYRGFGNNPKQLIPWSNTFIQETQKKKIIATAKHFPGHGLVQGDTHILWSPTLRSRTTPNTIQKVYLPRALQKLSRIYCRTNSNLRASL
ncbi:MAG: glycoside hydrolase family 3 protein [Flavobacteriia bacterium]|nr:glycoside hydrolase family 3 protein [Flavobacteriia bacterium]